MPSRRRGPHSGTAFTFVILPSVPEYRSKCILPTMAIVERLGEVDLSLFALLAPRLQIGAKGRAKQTGAQKFFEWTS